MESPEALRWVHESAGIQQLGNDILSVVHPELYHNAIQALHNLRKVELTKWAADQWVSAFTGIAVMSNRRSVPHVDRHGAPAWYDLLLTAGSYLHAELRMPEIGLSFDYDSGTAVAICGNALLHEVQDWGEGDRICYALFMREAVLSRCGCNWVGWSTKGSYQEIDAS
jgi:hypothetical protein